MLYPIFRFNKAIIGMFDDTFEPAGLTNIVSYRNSTTSIATLCKLSSVLNYHSAVDAYIVDNLENEYRFTVFYTLQSGVDNTLCRLITKTKEGYALISITDLFPAFNWAEREMWDLLGVFFIKHPDLRRILTYYGFSGHPLRKDFPLSGFYEARYVDSIKQVVYGPVELSQGYRLTNSYSVWVPSDA